MALKYLYVPSGYKAGKTYGVLPNVANADLDLLEVQQLQESTLTVLLKLWKTTNVPRLDYTDGSCPTLLNRTRKHKPR